EHVGALERHPREGARVLPKEWLRALQDPEVLPQTIGLTGSATQSNPTLHGHEIIYMYRDTIELSYAREYYSRRIPRTGGTALSHPSFRAGRRRHHPQGWPGAATIL